MTSDVDHVRDLDEKLRESRQRLEAILLEVQTTIVMPPDLRQRLTVLAKGSPKRELLRLLKRWGRIL